MQVDLVAGGIRAAMAVFVPLSKASIDITLGMLKTFSRVMEGVSSALAPKQAQAPRV